jgi:hypothetical protein
MPVKITRSAPRPSFGLPELLVAIHTSRQSCCKVEARSLCDGGSITQRLRPPLSEVHP